MLAVPDAARAEDDDVAIDVELVLAVDVSRSMDAAELQLQRDGYVAALRHPDVIAAIESGFYGRIAVTYVEWAGASEQTIVMPWRVIDGRATAEAAAALLSGRQGHGKRGTSVAAALLFVDRLFPNNGLAGTRRIVDISGDGPNNLGPAVTRARDALVDDGITINGLPVTLHPGGPGGLDAKTLTLYYEDCVTGGPDAFVLSVQAPELLAETIKRKMVLEISQRETVLVRAKMTKRSPRIDCEIGHRMPNMVPIPQQKQQNDMPLADPYQG
jgi:hypothetical protein